MSSPLDREHRSVSIPSFVVTRWTAEVSDSGADETRDDPAPDFRPLRFRAYDSDGILYAEGNIANPSDAYNALYYLRDGWGVVRVEVYNPHAPASILRTVRA